MSPLYTIQRHRKGRVSHPTMNLNIASFAMGLVLQSVMAGDGVPDMFIAQLTELYNKGVPLWRIYSLRRLFTGLAMAARTD